MENKGSLKGLRPETLRDLDLIAQVHGATAEKESGINPLKLDREGSLWLHWTHLK